MNNKKIILFILFIVTDVSMIYNLTQSSSWELYSNLEKILMAIEYTVITLLVYLVIYLIIRKPISKNNLRLTVKVIDQMLVDKKDSSIDIEKFKLFTLNRYRVLEEASSNSDYETIRKITTDEFYNMRVMQLEASKIDGKIDTIKNIELADFGIVSIKIDSNIESVNVGILVVFNQCEKDDKLERVIKRNVTKEYIITFVRTINNKDNKCPNCGSNYGSVASNLCPYCKSIIISDSYDFVISKIVEL